MSDEVSICYYFLQTPTSQPKLLYELEDLNLENNRLTNLDSISLLTFSKNSTIGLKNNRFSCEYLSRFLDHWHELTFVGDVWEQANNTDAGCQEKSKSVTYNPIGKASGDKIEPKKIRVIIKEILTSTEAIDEDINIYSTTEVAKSTTEGVKIDDIMETKVAQVNKFTESAFQRKQNEKPSNHFKFNIESSFKHLSHFNISRAHLNNTIEMIQLLGEPLESLDVSSNYIGVIRNSTFSLFVNLQYLNLSRTNISIIESGAFRHMKILKTLDLSNNYIDNVEFLSALDSSNGLETLILEGNLISSLDDIYKIEIKFPNLKRFDFSTNRFTCETVVEYTEKNIKELSEQSNGEIPPALIFLHNFSKFMCALNQLGRLLGSKKEIVF